MANFFIGVDGVSKTVKDFFIGVDGVAHNVKAAYIGVDGKARLFFGGFYTPNINETVVDLNEGETYNTDTLFAPGRYEIQIAGKPTTESTFAKNNCFTIQTVVATPFKIVGVTSTSATDNFTNSISGTKLVFGGNGGYSAQTAGASDSSPIVRYGSTEHGGACCHFIPANGTFGIDYLRCFQCGTPASGECGGGGAYGGGAGGRGAKYRVQGAMISYLVAVSGQNGKQGAGGWGGDGGYGTINDGVGNLMSGNPGDSGQGVGAGTATTGGVAWYNGTTWVEPTRSTNSTGHSYIKVIYRGRN